MRAVANTVGNDTQNFNPITSGVDFVTVQSTETLEMGFLNIGTFVSTAFNVLPETYDQNNNLVRSRDTLTFTDLNLGYGLLKWVDIGLDISYLANQNTNRNESGAQFSKTGLNEIRANTKMKIWGRNPIGLALIASMNLNQVRNNPFLGRGAGPTTNLELATDAEFWKNVVAFNVGYRFRHPGTDIEESYFTPLGSEFIASAAFSHYFDRWDFKFIGEVFGSAPASKRDSYANGNVFSAEALLGGKYDYNRFVSIHGGLSRKITEGLFAPNLRFYAGLNINLELLETGRASALPLGPPKPVIEVYSGYQPDDIKHLKMKTFEEIGADHEFTLRRSLPEGNKEDGKPPFEVFRLDGFEFAFGSSEIQPRYRGMLGKLITYLNSEPKVMKIRIEGHTDSLGSEERNKSRSTSRAAAVKEYLHHHGLNKEIEVDSIGYGSDKPIADNSNPQGRAMNRRVEVRILREISAPSRETQAEKK